MSLPFLEASKEKQVRHVFFNAFVLLYHFSFFLSPSLCIYPTLVHPARIHTQAALCKLRCAFTRYSSLAPVPFPHHLFVAIFARSSIVQNVTMSMYPYPDKQLEQQPDDIFFFPLDPRKARNDVLGPFIRLHPLSLDELPQHPSLPGYAQPHRRDSFCRGPLPPRFAGTGAGPRREPESANQLHSPQPGPVHREKNGRNGHPGNIDQPSSSRGPENTDRHRTHISDFVLQVYEEAIIFASRTLPATFEHANIDRTVAQSTSAIQMLKRKIRSGKLNRISYSPERTVPENQPPEYWHARRSRHTNAAVFGGASFGDFEEFIMNNHALHEADYTSSIYDTRKILDWNDELRGLHLCNRLSHATVSRKYPL